MTYDMYGGTLNLIQPSLCATAPNKCATGSAHNCPTNTEKGGNTFHTLRQATAKDQSCIHCVPKK